MSVKNLTKSLPAKITAIFLITLIFAGTLMVSAMAILGVSASLGEGNTRSASISVVKSYLYSYGYDVASDYHAGLDLAELCGQANFYFEIRSESDQVLWSSYTGTGDILTSITTHQSIYGAQSVGVDGHLIAEAVYTITLYAKKEMTRSDTMGWMLFLVNFSMQNQVLFIILSALGLMIFFALLIFLFCSVGHRKDKNEIVLNRVDRVPFDLFTFFFLIIAFFEYYIFRDIQNSGYEIIIILIVFGILDFLLLLWYLLSIAARIKTGSLVRNTLVFKLLHLFLRIASALGRLVLELFRHIPMIWKTLLAVSILTLLNLLAAVATRSGELFLLWLAETILLVPYVLLASISQHKLQKSASLIEGGDLNSTVDTRHMPRSFKVLANSLNSIRDGFLKAVDERMRSERFKTELITNVSHDIKTPLTSIINYIGLMKQAELSSETMKEYITVLDRQSARLKKLTDDLLEASKASTGNLVVSMAPADVGVLLAQTAGEYSEKLANLGMELVLQQPDEPVLILADGRHLWRIFDNLLGNICKYAQPSTRVYLSLEAPNQQVVITFRNISRSPLNISSEELMERFVRGDASRSTEGSGLGLAIARSLVDLLKGSMTLSIDGDLFKVILIFERLNELIKPPSAD